jgi:hypothetical protein
VPDDQFGAPGQQFAAAYDRWAGRASGSAPQAAAFAPSLLAEPLINGVTRYQTFPVPQPA